MTLKYFQKLCESKQYSRLLEKGVCVGERSNEEALILLFQIDHFYVEVSFHQFTDEVMSVRSFENTDELHPYLEGIDLRTLFY